MTDLHSRLLAELMKPDRYGASTIAGPPLPPKNVTLAEWNASHRLASILRMIAEDEGAAILVCESLGWFCSDSNVEKALAALSALLSILPEEK
jgi:hypothetical protein